MCLHCGKFAADADTRRGNLVLHAAVQGTRVRCKLRMCDPFSTYSLDPWCSSCRCILIFWRTPVLAGRKCRTKLAMHPELKPKGKVLNGHIKQNLPLFHSLAGSQLLSTQLQKCYMGSCVASCAATWRNVATAHEQHNCACYMRPT